ncbi:hypothetical protein PanWU01x14_370760 [Parasponia andersonii]|uniref:Uncharacterized protein n=1 Tax=Parasponia andersonii TaxID=3476 RepID=A0A2P5A466_PARAD|nr:hypothetical protein PanWU01x14_370760 [Parasponia andersonii]
MHECVKSYFLFAHRLQGVFKPREFEMRNCGLGLEFQGQGERIWASINGRRRFWLNGINIDKWLTEGSMGRGVDLERLDRVLKFAFCCLQMDEI